MNKLAAKYLRPSQIPTKACHGCGIGMIENWLLQAIDELGFDQDDVVVGTGIGCVGRQTFATWGGDNFGATHGLYKIVYDRSDRRVLGVHVVSRGASDIVGGLAVALKLGATVDDLAATHHVYPSFSEGVKAAAEQA